MSLDIDKIRKDFTILQQQIYNKPFVYLDNAATTQKPEVVIDSLCDYYRKYNSNVHRGVHYLSQKATEIYEQTRDKVKDFIGAECREEIVFTKGTTESINMIASSFGKDNLQEGDNIIVSEMEHHSNMVPWQMVAEQYGAVVKYIPFSEEGVLDMNAFFAMLDEHTKIVAITHVSNALGTVNPVKQIIQHAHQKCIPVLVDGAQSSPHMAIDVQELDCDFYCFSAHKMYGPTGVGVMYGKKAVLDKMSPYQGGGEMIAEVSVEGTTYNQLPYKFEAGTPNIADVVAFGTALEYMQSIGFDTIASHEQELLEYATAELSKIKGFRPIGSAPQKSGLISFLIDEIHPFDMGTIIDKLGVAVRTGHHCAQPVMHHYGISGTIRASFAVYNTIDDVDRLVQAVVRAKEMFS